MTARVAEEDTFQVGIQDAVPVPLGQVTDRDVPADDAGVVDEDVDCSPAFLQGADGAIDVVGAGDVGLNGDRADGSGGGFGGRRIDVDNGDSGACFQEPLGNRTADTSAGAGDDGGAAFEGHRVWRHG